MANFVLVVDPLQQRRDAFCQNAAARIEPVTGLTAGHVSSGNFHALWAAGPRAPILSASDDRGAALVIGDAMLSDGSRVDAGRLRSEWADPDSEIAPFDGYHAAVVYDATQGLLAGADIIGMMPFYWWGGDGVLLAGSSPELFRLHPSFTPRVDREGLVAILLTMHSVAGRTLFDGVHRLGAGHVLRLRPGAAPEERKQYRIPLSDRYHDLPFSAQVELLHEALTDSMRRHVPVGEQCALSLSGGRDSRLLAGLLAKQKSNVSAITFGNPDDMEMNCATAVARTSGFEQHSLPLDMGQQGEYGARHAKWLHCTTGFNSVFHWGSAGRLSEVPARIVTGYGMDSIVGGSHLTWAYDAASRSMSFATYFASINAYGIAESTLARLMSGNDASDLVEHGKTTIRNIYESYSDIESQRVLCFDLHHRQRFHVGNTPWLLSFGVWPVQPATDRVVLEVAGGLPMSALADRRAQDEIIRRFFPRLAELPLDRNGFNTEPLSPRLRYHLGRYVRKHVSPIGALLPRRRTKVRERRFYFRLFDFNGPGWRAIRRLAEPHRDKLSGLLDRATLDACLPPPDVELRVRDGIVGFSGPKILVGLMLWAGENL
jgi:asparagine synthase (glutamine-hydrolysing)